MRTLSRTLTACACALFMSAVQAVENERTPFTVADSISLTHVVNFSSDYAANAVSGTALFSPDRRWFLLHTRRGDLPRNVNVEALLLFEANEVERYLASSDEVSPPVPRTLVQKDIAQDWGEMSHIQWLNAHEVGLIAEGVNGRNQAFSVNVESGRLTQLTHSETDVASFAASTDDVLFYAHTRIPEQTLVTRVGDKSIGEVVFPDDPRETPLELFHASRLTGEVRRINAPAVRLAENFTRIWLSPSGDHAITFAPAVNAPAQWAAYQVPRYEMFGYTPDRARSDPTSWDLELRTRYQLVDLSRNVVKPLLDAPSGFLSLNSTPMEVFWPRDGHSVIVSNTYLPLDVRDEEIRKQRTAGPAIAEVDLISGEVTTIAWEPTLTPEVLAGTERLKRIVSIEWDREANRLTVARKSVVSDVSYSVFQKRGKTWRRNAAVRRAAPWPTGMVDRREALNERPKVYATGGHCACRRLLFDPNPHLEQFRLGRADLFKWTDSNDIEWQGGLIYPPDYVAGQRYPLIVQTHGFRPDEFLVDGPFGGTTAMAAQAFANVGFVVLQVEDNRRASTHDETEASRYSEGYGAAVAKLVDQGLVDASRVGLIGFSRTVRHAIQLVADHPELLAAVTLADGSWWGYMNELLSLNMPSDLAVQLRKLRGSTPAEVGLADWLARDPIYQLPQARTAVRIEAIGPGTVLGMWEAYAVLRQANRPVDFIYFPAGSHVLKKPMERLGSQGGNVDWFRFWLQGYEDPDPARAGQYVRWRKLREQRDASTRAQGSEK